MTKYNFNIEGMHCNSCKMLIKDVLEDLGASSVLISLDETKNTGKVSLDYSGDKRNIISAIKKEGYKVK
ncbi:MAG TPA: heavy-metal-associated domain-containing protein [Candidatus Nanoarchaeia archaeon]|nr:heavy-metal-associated domain-containing protein [Candidatus Nanoarchaeia archaeon]